MSSKTFNTFVQELTSQGWLANAVVGIALALIFIWVTPILSTPGSKVIAAGIGATILLWVGILALYRAVRVVPPQPAGSPPPVNLPAAPDQTSPAAAATSSEEEPRPTIGKGEKPRSDRAVAQRPVNAVTPPSVKIQQTNPVNSPAIVGDNATVNYGPPEPFAVTAEQQQKMGAVLEGQAGQDINLVCIGQGCESMESITPAFATWHTRRVQMGMYMNVGGGPGANAISRGVYVMDNGAPPEARAALEKALDAAAIKFKVAPWQPLSMGRGGGPIANLSLVIGNP